jgi:hypothetical protein
MQRFWPIEIMPMAGASDEHRIAQELLASRTVRQHFKHHCQVGETRQLDL